MHYVFLFSYLRKDAGRHHRRNRHNQQYGFNDVTFVPVYPPTQRDPLGLGQIPINDDLDAFQSIQNRPPRHTHRPDLLSDLFRTYQQREEFLDLPESKPIPEHIPKNATPFQIIDSEVSVLRSVLDDSFAPTWCVKKFSPPARDVLMRPSIPVAKITAAPDVQVTTGPFRDIPSDVPPTVSGIYQVM